MKSNDTVRERLKSVVELDALRRRLKAARDSKKVTVRVCMTGCRAKGADKVAAALRHEVSNFRLKDKVDIVETGCHGFCSMAPVMVVEPFGYLYCKVTPEDMHEIARTTLKTGEVIERLCYEDPFTGARIPLNKDIPFYKNQKKIVLRNCGIIDPTQIEQYIERDGYAALGMLLSQGVKPDKVVEMVKKSGLRGRGGAGFPTGIKWQLAHDQPSTPKYLVCNAVCDAPFLCARREKIHNIAHGLFHIDILGIHVCFNTHHGFRLGQAQDIVHQFHHVAAAGRRICEQLMRIFGLDIFGLHEHRQATLERSQGRPQLMRRHAHGRLLNGS